jgi:hypothetical protein
MPPSAVILKDPTTGIPQKYEGVALEYLLPAFTRYRSEGIRKRAEEAMTRKERPRSVRSDANVKNACELVTVPAVIKT